jgi:hypothetical protein
MTNTYSLDLELDSSQYGSIAYASQTNLNFTGNFTIECWVKLESISAFDQNLVIRKLTSKGWRFVLSSSGSGKYKAVADYDNGSNYVSIYAAADTLVTADIGNWHHLAIAMDVANHTGVIYKDGGAVSITQDNAGNPTSIGAVNANLYIGCSDSVADFFDGLIDEVRVWNDLRTAQEIYDNYNKQLVGDEAGLVAYYKFNNSALDETANNNDLTLSGSPVYSTDVPFVGAATSNGNFLQFF